MEECIWSIFGPGVLLKKVLSSELGVQRLKVKHSEPRTDDSELLDGGEHGEEGSDSYCKTRIGWT